MSIKQNKTSHLGLKKTIVDWFEHQAKISPEAIALVFEEQQLSFKTLDLKANQLANHLLKYELGEETLVAICIERSVEMIIGILGILKAGAAYVPLSPESPTDRLQFMLSDTNAPIILSQEHLLSKIPNPKEAKMICLDKDWSNIAKESNKAPKLNIKAENLIYTIYTSGSTGKPKGVLVEHRNVVNLVQSHLDFFQLPVKRFLYAYSFAFDGSVLLIFQTLLQGATLVIAPENLEKDIKRLSAFIEYHQISNLLSFPSLYAILLEQAKISQLQSLESVNLAGEAFPGTLAIQHQKLLPNCRIVNQYGPTEATVGTTAFIVPPDFNQKKIPIGTCVDHTEIFILNKDLQKLTPGKTGEIYIGGAGVARGYLNRKELTQSRFIPNPFSKDKNDRLYKTGDLAQWLPDGNIDFIGRSDFQVKLRGYRIELGEIEAVLSQHPHVREVVTIITDAPAADQKLVAYIVAKKEAQLNTSKLRTYLLKLLPDYMIPAFFIFLEKMPLANSGKIDRKALPQPGKQRPELKQSYVAPETKLEEFIAHIWCQILELDKIGTQDKFFELGGNSLQAAKFINIIQETLGEAVFIVTIFDTPTIASYAAMLEKDYPQAVKRKFEANTALEDKHALAKAKLDARDFKNFDTLVPKFNPINKKQHQKNPPAIFILAPPRSGTTLLRVMLAGHPDIFAANELQLLGFNTLQERNHAYQNKFSLWQEGLIRTIMEIKAIDAHEAKAIVQEFETKEYTCQQVYQELQNWIGNKILVDKSPSYATDSAVLQNAEQNFDQAIYLHLVRHPYAMINSFARMHMDQVMYLKNHDYTPKELGELIWTKSHQNILDFLEDIPAQRQFRVNYEDLVQNPKEVMEQLCQTTGISFHPDLLSPYKDLDKKMTDGIYADSKPMGDIRLLSHKKINPELSKSWEGVLKDNFLSSYTWEVAKQLAYQHPDQISAKEIIPDSQEKGKSSELQNSDIAIIGMSGRFAGAKNLDHFWDNLCKGTDVSVQFSAEDLKAEGIDPAVLNDPNYVNRGMPLEDADCFDASFFGYLPKEAALMDPQHRIFLECAYEAMESTGYDPEKYKGTIGIFGGVARNTYLVNNVMTHPQYFKSVDDFLLGITLEKDFPSTRVAYKLNLKGPAVNIQTACSSSGVAVHLACQSIISGDSDMVLVGGGRIQPPVNFGHFHKEGHALSPDGYCKAFDADAQGMVRGNGMAFIALKKLSQAIADGDTIHAVIKGTAINNDGSDKIGFTAPSIKGQTSAISKAYQKTGINPETISYIEAHGTGTLIGDPIEIAGLSKAFQQFTDKKGFCAIGSVKTNIGHLDAGASIAGIIKTVLALKHQVIPPTLHFKKANPQIEFEKTPFFVNDTLRKWETKDTPRRAGVSSFGLGGTNAHIILEEAPKLEQKETSRSHQLILLSAKTDSAIHQASFRLGEYLEQHADLNFHHIATTLQQGRKHFQHRKILVAKTSSETANYLLKNDKRHIVSKTADKVINKVVFMFPGGGAQHTNMGWNLYEEEPTFRNAVDECLDILKTNHQLALKDVLYPERTGGILENNPITDPLHAITLLFTIEYATAKLWISWGIIPSEMIGHSLGEYTAACIAGVISLKDSLALVAKRGRLFKTLAKGAMLSVPLSVTELEQYMDDELSFAAINKPDHCVISGSVAAIDRIKEKLNKEEIHAPRLHISVAAHSKMVTPILDEFEAFLKTINYQEAKIPIVSNVTGEWIKPEEIQQSSYWVKHLRQTVKFSNGISQIFKLSERFLLEIGPGQTLSTFARQHPQKPTGQLILASLKHPKEKTDDLAFILKTLGQLWLSGMEIDWSLFAQHLPFQRTALPPYPFEKKRFWIEAKPSVPTNPLPKTIGSEPIDFNVKQTTMNVPEVQRKNLVARDLKDIFHQLSGISADELTDYATFLELGFDSLFLTQAISKIKKKFDVKLNFRQLFDDLPTIDTLSEYIDEQLPDTAYQTEIAQTKEVLEKSTPSPSQTNIIPPNIPTSTPAPTTPIIPFPVSTESSGTIQDIINQQLSLMQQQLALLSGQKLNINAPIIQAGASPTPQEKTIPEITPKPTTNKIQDQGEKHGPWRPIDKKDNDGLSEQQRKYLQEFIQYYTTRTKSSQALITKQRPKYADPRSITNFNKLWKDMVYQIAVDRSKGSKLWDIDGNEYVDYVMAFGISLMGHTPDFIQEAVSKQLEKGLELGVLTPLAHQLAELLCELSGMERVTFVNTGSEALAAAVRSARTVTAKDKIIVFEGDYHGISDELLARSIQRNGQSITMPVSPGIPLSLMQNVIVLNYDAPNVLEVIRENADELAAILIEPVQPMNPHIQRKELFHQIRKITADNDIALIFDEMITGFRIAPRGAQEWFDIEVDLVCYGKTISGGLPMAALAGKSKYLDVFDGGMWQFGDQSIPEAGVTFFGGTFVKHPLSLASAFAALSEIKKRGPQLYQDLNEKTRRFAERLKSLFLRTKVPLQIFSTASIFAIKVVDNNPLSRLFYFYLRAKGVHLTERAGLVSTAHTEEDLDFTYKAIEEIIKEMQTAGFFKITVAEVEDKNLIVPSPLLVYADAQKSSIVKQKKKIPLTEGQQEIWLEQQLGNDAAAAYNLSSEISLKGQICLEKMRQAIQALIDRHEALRTRFHKNELFQTILPSAKINIALEDLTGLEENEKTRQLENLRFEEGEKAFDIFNEALFRVKIIRLTEGDHRLLMTAHHIIADGWSCGILAHDLGKLYTALSTNTKANLPEVKQLSTFALEKNAYQGSVAEKEAANFWLNQFKDGTPVLELPTDRSRPVLKTYAASCEKMQIETDLYESLKLAAKQYNTTFFNFIYTAFQCFLHRLSQQDDFVLGITAASQATSDNPYLVAHGVNLIPVRLHTNGEVSFAEQLKITRNTVLDAFEHQDYAFGSLVKALQLPRDLSRQPIVSIIFNMDTPIEALTFADMEVSLNPIPRNYETFDIFINVKPQEKGIDFEWIYNTDLFYSTTVQRRLSEFKTFLESIILQPDASIDQLNILPESEAKQLANWNDTKADFPEAACIHTLFEKQAEKTPNKIAVEFKNQYLSYEELNIRANQLAHYLVDKGIQKSDFVGIYLDRSIDLLVGLIAIIKVGAIYVPLDPVNPTDRLQVIMEDAQAKYIITQKTLKNNISDPSIQGICLEEEIEKINIQSILNPSREIHSADDVYVIYTSGSTGKPKGVIIPHYAVIDHHLAMQEAVGIHSDEVIFGVASISFDPSVQDLFLPLIIGAKIIIGSHEAKTDGFLLKERLEESKATLMQATPATWRMLLLAGWQGNENFTALCGGEGLTKELADSLINRTKALHNIYGPTETTIWSTTKKLTGDRLATKAETGYEPVGRPMKNVQIYILDKHLQQVPIGIPGEIYVGGVGVAPNAYFKRPQLSLEKFIANPFSDVAGAQMYRTGDIARYLPNGDIEYLRRADNQVKIRGYRIELGEIESTIAQFEGIRENVVIVREDQKDNKELVAYLILDKTYILDRNNLKSHLKEKLPNYMVPRYYVVMDAFPLTATMKINRGKLPVPDRELEHLSRQFVVPTTKMEKLLTEIWEELLGLSKISIVDSFFDLGGHSLIAVNMMAKIEQATGKKLPLSSLIENSTIQRLAKLLSQTTDKNIKKSSLIPIKPNGTKPPIYILHGAGNHVLLFNTLASHMDEEQPVYGLEPRGLDGEADPLDRMEDIAAHYIAEIQKLNPDGPYALAGYSFGGLIAFEMAQQLEAMGKTVMLLGMFDTVLRPEITGAQKPRGYYHKLSELGKKIVWNLSSILKDPIPNIQYKSYTWKRRYQRWLWSKTKSDGTAVNKNEIDYAALVDRMHQLAYDHYRIKAYRGKLHLFRAKERRFYMDDFEYLGWKAYAKGGIIVRDVPGDHLHLFNPPNGQKFARILQACLDEAADEFSIPITDHSLKK